MNRGVDPEGFVGAPGIAHLFTIGDGAGASFVYVRDAAQVFGLDPGPGVDRWAPPGTVASRAGGYTSPGIQEGIIRILAEALAQAHLQAEPERLRNLASSAHAWELEVSQLARGNITLLRYGRRRDGAPPPRTDGAHPGTRVHCLGGRFLAEIPLDAPPERWDEVSIEIRALGCTAGAVRLTEPGGRKTGGPPGSPENLVTAVADAGRAFVEQAAVPFPFLGILERLAMPSPPARVPCDTCILSGITASGEELFPCPAAAARQEMAIGRRTTGADPGALFIIRDQLSGLARGCRRCWAQGLCVPPCPLGGSQGPPAPSGCGFRRRLCHSGLVTCATLLRDHPHRAAQLLVAPWTGAAGIQATPHPR